MSSQTVIAAHLDIDSRHVRRMVSRGVFPERSTLGWDIDECRIAYIRFLRNARGTESGDLDGAHERARKDKAQADKYELELAVARGELVPVAQVATIWARAGSEFKTMVLGVPSKLAPQVIGMRRIPQVKAALEAALYECLDTLSEAGGSIVQGGEASSEADGEPVGGQVPPAESGVERGAGAVAD